jgi:DNA-binding LytR/AlgR family response regulator
MINQQKEDNSLQIPGYRQIKDAGLIIWLEGSGNYTIVYLKDNLKPLMVSRTLKYFELHLTDFIRTNKSSLVNPGYIDKVIQETAKTMHLELTGGVNIPVSRRRISDILSRLDSYLALTL